MKLVDALEILRRPVPDDANVLRITLACGFTPLHLETFIAAELRQALPSVRPELSVGRFDDLVGTIRTARDGNDDAVVVVVEWPDVDPRLGLRRLGGWRTSDLDEVVADAERQLVRLASEVSETAERTRVVCSLPTLPIPPVFAQGTYEAGAHELELRALVASLARELARHPSIRVAGAQRLAAESPPSTRHDPKSELATGFPYTREHASALARILARLVAAPPAKKGLITDLDDTLWNGIVGEIGTENVSWEEASGGHAHALYQQFLASLASAGVLIGAASKNDSAVVEDVFARDDILLDKEAVFPFEVHWNAKSESVGRILDAWNVAADSVVFVDDSPMEVAQVQSVFPEIEGFVFPGSDYRALGEFFVRLRDLFGKHATTDEDALRTMSIRSSVGFRTSAAAVTHSMEDFLREARGEITFSCGRERDARAFELINKTNQFNLNGKRLGENAFASALLLPGAFLLSAGYKDKYGPLGSIAAVLGQVASGVVTVHSWVMSCRAFSRRIEHHCLSFLFENFEATQLVLAYAPTERNRPLQEFLASIVGDDLSAGEVVVSREAFEQRSPALVHEVGGVRRG